MMKYFFWIAFAVFLAASIPHVAYFFASFEPTIGPTGIWWWVVSYAIAISIDVTVYLLSWTAFQRYRKYRTPRAVWQHWLLIIMCTVFSWAVNWAYAKQFHNGMMLSSAENAVPWLTTIFPFMASAFPLLGIVYTMMAETITETAAEEKQEKLLQLRTLSELAKQAHLPVTSLRRVLASGTRLSSAHTLAEVAQHRADDLASAALDLEQHEMNRPITGHFVTLEHALNENNREPDATTKATSAPPLVTIPIEGSSDKLQMTIEALKANPQMTDEELAMFLSLKRPTSARFWRLKALEILNTSRQESSRSMKSASSLRDASWTPGGKGTLANGAGSKG